MRKRQKSKKQYHSYKYIICFIGVLIFVLVSITLYKQYVDKTMIENENNIQSLEKVIASVDYKINTLDDMVEKVQISDIININSIRRDPYNRKLIIDELENLIAIHDFIEEIVVYLDNEKYMYTSATTITVSDFGDYLYIFEKWSKDDMIQLFDSISESVIHTLELVNNKDKKITFFYPLIKNGINRYGNVMLIVDESQLFDQQLLNESQYISIRNENNEYIIDNTNTIQVNESQLNTGYYYKDEHSKYIKNEQGWTYTLVTNNKDINTKLTKTIIINVVLLILVALVIVFIIRIIFKSFNKEMMLIETPEELKKSYIIHKLLTHGTVNEDSLEAINVIGRYVTVGIILLDNLQENREEEFQLIKHTLASNKYLNLCMQREKNRLICIFSFKDKEMNELDVTLKDIQSKLYKVTHENIMIGVGRIYEGYEKISRSYMEATKALGYQMIHGNNEVILYSEIDFGEVTKDGFTYDNIYNLKKCIEHKDQQGINSSLCAIKEYILSSDIPIYVVKGIFYNIIYEILKAIEQSASLDIKEKLIELQNSIDYADIDDFLASVLNICIEYIEQNEHSNRSTLENMLSYINNHYLDIDFSTEAMADHFNISSANLCQMFKSLTKSTISEHLIQLRMAKAKELLINTQLPLKDIAEEVGYYHVSSFIRRFKKIEGITPGEYRKLNKRI